MSSAAVGAMAGLFLASGVLLALSWVAAHRRPSLSARVTPYVSSPARQRLQDSKHASALALLGEVVASALPMRWRQQSVRVARSPRERIDELAWSSGGLIVGGLLAFVAIQRGSSVLAMVVLPGIGLLIGFLGQQREASRRESRRRDRISSELPDIADLLAFAVAAGEPPVGALDRVGSMCAGELAQAVNDCVASIRAGESVTDALVELGVQTGSDDVQRFVDGLVVSMERGTPLSDVLRAQAADARARDRRRLMELAGRKDVLMLIPVVFLILPCVVLVAVYPGVQAISLVVS